MTLAYVLIGILFYLLAVLMPLARGERQGRWYGIRTPQTLSSVIVWNRVHAQAWWPLFFAGSLIFLSLLIIIWLHLEKSLLICIGVTFAAFIISGILMMRLVKRISDEENIKISPKSISGFETAMAGQIKGMQMAGFVTSGFLLVIAVFLPLIASYGPESLIGIKTEVTSNSPEIWNLVHMKAIIPTLAGGIAIALMSYLIMKTRWRPTTRLWTWALLYFTILGITLKYAIWW